MLGLRKKKEEAEKRAAEEAAAAAAAGEAPSSSGDAGGGADAAAAGDGGTGAPKKSIGIFGPAATGRRAVTSADLRVTKDIRDLEETDQMKWCLPDPANLKVLKVTIKPDRSSLWFPGTYEFTVTVTDEYPHKAPVAHCYTQVYHPNIDMEGHVCLNILRTDWNPVLSLYAVLNGLLFLFYEPNPMDPLNFDAAALLRSDQEAFKRKVALTLRGGSVDGKPFPRFC